MTTPRAAASALLAAALATAASRADTVNVYVYDFDFSINPPGQPVVDAVVNIGDTVRWIFLDSGHSTTSVLNSPESWDSGYVSVVGTAFEHTFTNPGEWWYYCFPHGNPLPNGTAAGMAGTVTVLPGPGAAMLLLGAGCWSLRRRRLRQPARPH